MTLSENSVPVDPKFPKLTLICPYLGTLPDPHTSVAYPSGANFCHRSDDPQIVSPAHQNQHCLVEAFDSCATYRESFISVASIDVAGPQKKGIGWKRPLIITGVILLFCVVLLGAYTIFPPFNTDPVDGPTLSNHVLTETAFASELLPTPTLESVTLIPEEAPVDAVVVEAILDQTDVLAEAPDTADPTDTTDTTTTLSDVQNYKSEDEDLENVASEDAKMAPVVATSTATLLDSEVAAAANDLTDETSRDEVDSESTSPVDSPEAMILPTVVAATEETEPEVVTEEIEPTPLPAPMATVAATQASASKIADGTAVIRTGALNVRRGPGPQFNAITLVYNGQHVILLGRNGDNSWVKVRLLNGVEGWIYAPHIEAGQSLSEIPYIPRSLR